MITRNALPRVATPSAPALSMGPSVPTVPVVTPPVVPTETPVPAPDVTPSPRPTETPAPAPYMVPTTPPMEAPAVVDPSPTTPASPLL